VRPSVALGEGAHAPGSERPDAEVLAGLLEASLDGVAVVDAERRIRYVNPAACQIFGRSADELLGQDVLIVYPPRLHETILERFPALLAGGSGRASSVIMRPDGEEREADTARVRFVIDGRPLVGAVFRDVTDARRLEREAAALAQMAASVSIAGSLEATLDALARSVVQASEAVACVILLYDAEQEQLRTVGTHGLPDGYAAAMEAAKRGGARPPSVNVARSRQMLVVPDLRRRLLADPLFAPLHDLLREVTWEPAVYVPLRYRGRVVGALVGMFQPQPGPTSSEISFLTAIADQAAVAVENAQLHDRSQRVAVLEERQRLARELHDSVSQALYGIALGARTARTLLDREPARAAEPLDYVLQLAEAGLAEMRALIFELRPESLAAEGLVAALSKQADALRARHGLAVGTALGAEPEAPLAAKEALYRIGQEALHNAVKHARAARVDVRLEFGPTGVELEVADDGAGFDPAGEFPGHLGLRSMRERAASAGGTVEVDSAPGRGTRVRAWVPIGAPTAVGDQPPPGG
jgi:PAS domain S-box-containing protein